MLIKLKKASLAMSCIMHVCKAGKLSLEADEIPQLQLHEVASTYMQNSFVSQTICGINPVY